jgi:hypothetical protein
VAAAAGPATGPGGPGGDQNDSNRLLLENRYIDDKGQPLSSIPPDSEFKLMPIRLSLVMNQLRLPSLLAECANSSMPIEVRRVRICKSQSTPLELATAASAAPSDARRGFRMQPRESVHRSSQESGGGPSQELGPEDVPVEIYGVIYIFNPPNREKFGVGAAPARSPTVPPADMPGARPSSPLSPPKK